MASFMKFGSITMRNKQISIVALLFFAALVPRLIFFLIASFKHIDLSTIAYEDASSYIQAAKYIFTQHIFAYDNGLPLQPDSFRTPGYPVFVYLFSFGLWSLKLLTLVQYILVFLSSLVLYRLSLALFKEKSIALGTALLFVLEPYYVFWSGLTMSEGLFVPLLILGVYFTYQSIVSSNTKNILATGLLFGLAALTRPVLLPFFVIMVATFIVTWLIHQHFGLATLIKKAFILVMGFLIVAGPWSLRNHRLFGSWNISSVGSYNSVFYDSALLLSRKEHLSWEDAVLQLTTMLGMPNTPLITFTNLKYEPKLIAVSTTIAKTHFKDFLILRTENFAALLLNDGYTHIGRALKFTMPRPLRILSMAFWALQYIAIIYYLACTKLSHHKTTEKIFICFALLLIGYFALVTGAVSSARYRVPIEPFIFLISAPGLYRIYRKLHGSIL